VRLANALESQIDRSIRAATGTPVCIVDDAGLLNHRTRESVQPLRLTAVRPGTRIPNHPGFRVTTGLAKTFSKQPQQSSVQQSSILSYSSQPPQNKVVDNSIVVTTVRSGVVLRAEPGADFSAIGHVPGGTELETTDCIGGWCQVEFNGIAGFVGAADLGNDRAIRRSSARKAENRKLTSAKHLRTNKIVSRERSQTKRPPATNGVANAERHDQSSGNGDKNEKPAPQLTDTERQALFDDFLKWYLTVRLNP
jgi:uncharacterized protein YraI